ncbi:MAG: hypothetical protein ACPLKQ_05820 [Candidatus Bathyarchaeales archaeon]
MGVKLHTIPPIHLNPIFYRRMKDGTLKAYWKAEIHTGGRKYYLCYVPQIDAQALLSGRLDPVSYFNGVGKWIIRPAERRIAKAAGKTISMTYYARVAYNGNVAGEKGVRYRLILKVLLIWKKSRVYVYIKRLKALHGDLAFPFPKSEKLQYLGRCDEAWRWVRAIHPLLEARGYLLEGFEFYPSRRRGRPRTHRETKKESIEDWGFEAKQARYETLGEEPYLDELETWGEEAEIAERELWGEEADAE